MFTPSTLFKSIICPEGQQCQLLNCIFSHEVAQEQQLKDVAPSGTSQRIGQTDGHEIEPPTKRRKIAYDRLEDKPLSRADVIRKQLAADRSGTNKDELEGVAHLSATSKQAASKKDISSLKRAVSPPVVSSKPNNPQSLQHGALMTSEVTPWTTLKEAGRAAKETLNPRMINPAPASHARRVLYVQHIHKKLGSLNDEVRKSNNSIGEMSTTELKSYVLNDQELIKVALDEEEVIARTKPKIYENAIRTCLAAYQKMAVSAWLDKLKSMSQADPSLKPAAQKSETPNKAIDIGLPIDQAHLMLPLLVVDDQTPLKGYGYTTRPPSEADATEARAAVESCKNHEECDRCGSRFRLFPDRSPETGRLTSNGPCRYHWARKTFPSKQKTDSYTGSNEAMYPCCGQSLGTEGCTEHDDHVYKCSASSRLAAVMPFISTPDNPSPQTDSDGKAVRAVVFDCEMGYTTNGLELIRLTAVSWPEGKQLVDVLVRPLGAIIDLNTRFSGVKAEQMANAEPFVRSNGINSTQPTIVENPSEARQLLCSFLTPKTPLIGHAIENDLNATRLCHPAIIDTVLLFSHPRGLPFRYGLKMLTKKHLKRNIQTGGSAGHDSLEDAIATGDLVKVKAAEMWSDMSGRGWRVKDDKLIGASDDKASQASPGWRVSSKKTPKTQNIMQGNRLAQILDEARSQDKIEKQENKSDAGAPAVDTAEVLTTTV